MAHVVKKRASRRQRRRPPHQPRKRFLAAQWRQPQLGIPSRLGTVPARRRREGRSSLKRRQIRFAVEYPCHGTGQRTQGPSWVTVAPPTVTHPACATTAAVLGDTPSTAMPFAPSPIFAHTWQPPTCVPLSTLRALTRRNDDVPVRGGRPLLYST
jgi:hypothetical protein